MVRIPNATSLLHVLGLTEKQVRDVPPLGGNRGKQVLAEIDRQIAKMDSERLRRDNDREKE